MALILCCSIRIRKKLPGISIYLCDSQQYVLLFPQERNSCYSDCLFTHTEGNVSLTFDFSLIGSVGTLMIGPSFTSKGTKYFHHFNISLCGGQVSRKHTHTHTHLSSCIMSIHVQKNDVLHKGSLSLFKDHLAACTDNVTDLTFTDQQRQKGEGANAVKTFICQSTIIPATGRGFHTALSSQSINLADTFLG